MQDRFGEEHRLTMIGRRNGGLPEDVLREMDFVIEQSKNCTGLHLCLAINYGSRPRNH